MVDLDGSGAEAAVVFWRLRGEAAPRVHIYTKEHGEFVLTEQIEGVGDQVDRVEYADLFGDGRRQMLLSWRVAGGSLRALSVHSWVGGVMAELLNRTFDSYALIKTLENGPDNLLLITLAAGEQPGNAEWVAPGGEGLAVLSTAPLSAGVTSLMRVRVGALSGGIPAVFVTGEITGDDTREVTVITDVFAFRRTRLDNVTYQEDVGRSIHTVRRDLVAVTDIAGDGVMSLPRPVRLPPMPQDMDNPFREDFWRIEWYNIDNTGTEHPLLSTVHNTDAGWYLILPERWGQRLTLRRDDRRAALGEKILYFYHTTSGQPIRLAAFYSLTGAARARSAQVMLPLQRERETILVLSEVTVAATLYELPAGFEELDITMSELMRLIRAIEPEWIPFES
jgi:hypothetical protein